MTTSKLRVLLFDVWAFTPYTEISLEIAEKHQEHGDIVQIVNVATKLPHWEYKPLLEKKSNYMSSHFRLMKKLEKIAVFARTNGIGYSSDLLINPKEIKMSIPENICNIAALKDFEWNDFDMGMGLASFLISRTKDIEPDIAQYKSVINSVFSSAVVALYSFKQWYDKFRPDLVLIYNARTPLNRIILRFCQKEGYNVKVVDRGGAKGKYTITPTFNHNRIVMSNFIEEYWKTAPIPESEKKRIAERFFIDRISGISTKNFVGDQKRGSLPDGFEKEKKNITFFQGSFTEYASIDKENNADVLFNSQFDAVKEIANYLNNTDYNFYLRIHPNTKKNYHREYERWLELKRQMKDEIIFIDGDDPVDSYELAKNSDKVIVYMSSMGIESVLLNVPSIVIGNSRYHRFGSNYVPSNRKDLFDLLTTEKLPPKSIIGALKYGFFYATGGHDFKHFVYTDKYLGLYRGIDFNSLKSYPIKTRLIAYYLFFMDQARAKGLLSAIKIFFNKEKMEKFRKNPISEM